MKHKLPNLLKVAINQGVWRNPSKDILPEFFSECHEVSDLELFNDLVTMQYVSEQIDSGGLIDNLEFCMVRTRSELLANDDVRLVFDDSLFIGGSKYPGDDVLVALDISTGIDPTISILDWSKPVPKRWVMSGHLSNFIDFLVTSG